MIRPGLRLLAWAGTLAAIVYASVTVPFSEIASALRRASSWTIPAIIALELALFVADGWGLWLTLRWYAVPIGFRRVLLSRGGSYVAALLNYAVGQGAVVYLLARDDRVCPGRATGSVLLTTAANVLLLLAAGTAGVAMGAEVPGAVTVALAGAHVGAFLYLVVIACRPAWLARQRWLGVLFEAGLRGHGRVVAARVPHFALLLVLSWVSLRAFGVTVPAGRALLCLPVVYVVGALPIAVQGLGTTQVAMVTFFAAYAAGPPATQQGTVLSSSLTAHALSIAVQVAVGIACLAVTRRWRTAGRDDGAPRPPEDVAMFPAGTERRAGGGRAAGR